MQIQTIYAIYFSPTGGTKKVVKLIANSIGQELGIHIHELDFTKFKNRQKRYAFCANELIILGMPVYAGRIPNKILPDLEQCLFGSGATPVIPICVYGNRNYDEALRELILLSEGNGMVSIGVAAVVSQHAFSDKLAKGRPDAEDQEKIETFARNMTVKIQKEQVASAISVDRETPIGSYYIPKKEDGTPAKFLKAKPVTDMAKCNQCGQCAEVCPMQSIDTLDAAQVNGICIKCQACVKKCPVHAKSFTDTEFLSHVKMLEHNYMERKEPFFILND